MKTGLSILCIAPGARLLEDFLAGLAERPDIPLEAPPAVLITGNADDLPSDLTSALRARGIAARFLKPCDDTIYTYQDWMNAVMAAESPWIMHADQNTRFVSASGLKHNLNLLRTSPQDILHFKARYASTPSPDDLRGKDILYFFLNVGIWRGENVNKIYSRALCVKACRELDHFDCAGEMPADVFPHLMLASLAEKYSGKGLNVAEFRPPAYAIEDHACGAAAGYNALKVLPGCFEKLGHPEESIRLARYRLRAELALNLGRTCRSPDVAGVADVEAHNAARNVLLRFFSREDLLNALLLGTAKNAEKVTAIYRTIYEDTVYNPCAAYEMKRFSGS
jgi:hypothetical protein